MSLFPPSVLCLTDASSLWSSFLPPPSAASVSAFSLLFSASLASSDPCASTDWEVFWSVAAASALDPSFLPDVAVPSFPSGIFSSFGLSSPCKDCETLFASLDSGSPWPACSELLDFSLPISVLSGCLPSTASSPASMPPGSCFLSERESDPCLESATVAVESDPLFIGGDTSSLILSSSPSLCSDENLLSSLNTCANVSPGDLSFTFKFDVSPWGSFPCSTELAPVVWDPPSIILLEEVACSLIESFSLIASLFVSDWERLTSLLNGLSPTEVPSFPTFVSPATPPEDTSCLTTPTSPPAASLLLPDWGLDLVRTPDPGLLPVWTSWLGPLDPDRDPGLDLLRSLEPGLLLSFWSVPSPLPAPLEPEPGFAPLDPGLDPIHVPSCPCELEGLESLLTTSVTFSFECPSCITEASCSSILWFLISPLVSPPLFAFISSEFCTLVGAGTFSVEESPATSSVFAEFNSSSKPPLSLVSSTFESPLFWSETAKLVSLLAISDISGPFPCLSLISIPSCAFSSFWSWWRASSFFAPSFS